jgi:ubiquinone/menaquinone biosynthesis C-methylase UbiE
MYPRDEITALPLSTVTETAESLLDLNGARALDIGCGPGPFTLFLARHAAVVAGVDPNDVRIAEARVAAAEAELAIDFEIGVAEDLPFDDANFDIVAFSNSLHHVPADRFSDAMREAARVLVPGGVLWVAEPLPKGGHYELCHLWNDETEIRRLAYEALQKAVSVGLEMTKEVFFSHPAHYVDFEAFAAERSARSAHNAEMMQDRLEEVRALFEARARPDDGYLLDRATRVNLLVKTT